MLSIRTIAVTVVVTVDTMLMIAEAEGKQRFMHLMLGVLSCLRMLDVIKIEICVSSAVNTFNQFLQDI